MARRLLLARLGISCFRNIESAQIEPLGGINYFTGYNGQGKTNLLEAIVFTLHLRSFRTSRNWDLVMRGKAEASLLGEVAVEGYASHELEVRLGRGAKRARIDGHWVKSARQFLWRFPAVFTGPEDSATLERGPSARRILVDRLASQLFEGHWTAYQAYHKTLKERNAALKQESVASGFFDAVEETLAREAELLVKGRRTAVDRVAKVFPETLKQIADVEYDVRLAYRSSLLLAEGDNYVQALQETLAARRSVDLAAGHTTVGPHLDDVDFVVEGRQAKEFASRGQKKALLLAWKVAAARLLAQSKGLLPILVMDDAFSELDGYRQRALARYLAEYEGQCFLSGPSLPAWIQGERAFVVEEGRIRPVGQGVRSG